MAVPALVGGVFLAQLIQPGGPGPAANATAPSVSREDTAARGTYKDPDFKKIAEGGRLTCDPMGAYEARCVDADGQVMVSEASVGTSTAFTFSYGFEKVGFRIFPDEDAARAWAAEDANRQLYHNVIRRDRIVLWGTDQKRLADWDRSLTDTASETTRARHAAMMSGVPVTPIQPPLSDRLAFLAFGTLHITEEAVQHAVAAQDTRSVQLLRAVELVLGNAASSRLGRVPSGPDDAVATVVDATAHETPETSVEETKKPRPPTASDPRSDVHVTETPATSGTMKVDPATNPPVPQPEPSVTPDPDPEPKPDPEQQPEPLPDPTAPPAREANPEPETAPAPPGGEEPDTDGLSVEALPGAWTS